MKFRRLLNEKNSIEKFKFKVRDVFYIIVGKPEPEFGILQGRGATEGLKADSYVCILITHQYIKMGFIKTHYLPFSKQHIV